MRLEVAPELEKARVLRWVEMLRAAGVSGVHEVAGGSTAPADDPNRQPPVQLAGPGRVLVRAALGPAGNLHIGSDAFRSSDRGRLETFIKKLRSEGAPGADPTLPLWGLGEAQFQMLERELKTASQFQLDARPFDAVLAELRSRTRLPVELTPEARAVAHDRQWTARTGRLSLGTALAFLLSQHELVFEPRQASDGRLSLLVLRAADSQRPWPIGLAPDRLPGHIAPRLMANARYQTNQMPLGDVIAVFARELEMDVLLDTAGLTKNNVDPIRLRSTILITGGTFQSAIRKTLAPLGLKHELRIDESDQPFLWVTPGEPTGPPPRPKVR